MGNPEIGFGKSGWYWLFLAAWGITCIAFITFLFVHSSSKMQSEALSKLMQKGTGIANSTGLLSLYPANAIIFNMSDSFNSTKPYVKILENIVKDYQCMDGVESCDYHFRTNNSQQCSFNISLLGNACSIDNAFGYLNRKPCIFLRLEEMNDFVPESLTNPPTWLHPYSENHAFVNCNGKRNIDANRMRISSVWPSYGFPIHYYPITPQNGKSTGDSFCAPHSPLVAVQFPDLATGCTIHIQCQVWAANARQLKVSKVEFSIHIH